MKKKILIRFPHGLGDTVQASVVLKHLRKYRPDFEVTFRCGQGKGTGMYGLCHTVLHDHEPDVRDKDYDVVLTPGWFENFCHYTDRPNSKVTNCLHEVFGLDYDPDLGRYECTPNDWACNKAQEYLNKIVAKTFLRMNDYKEPLIKAILRRPGKTYKTVAIHPFGNTSPERKNINGWQLRPIIENIIAARHAPIVLDWDNRYTVADQEAVFVPRPGTEHDIWGNFGSGDAGVISAIISYCKAFIGIDSGPGKIASCTDTPSLIVWTGHHPIQFHDPAPNTLHLVPVNHRQMPPCNREPKIADYFESHYRFRMYADQYDLICQMLNWLGEILEKPMKMPANSFVMPNGIGDVCWAFTKIEEIADGNPIDIILSGNPANHIDYRSVPFVKRFPFVRNVEVADVPALADLHNVSDPQGRYRYRADGVCGYHHFLCPNGTLEKGGRLEDWLPQYKVNYDIMDKFDWTGTERGVEEAAKLGDFCVFYLGPESGNTVEGHGRGFAFEPRQWVELGSLIGSRGVKIVVVGADYDRSYWQRYVAQGVVQDGQTWVDMIGQFEIGEAYAFIRKARFYIGYQCGLGIISHYLGQRVAQWWRADGDSIHPHRFICFDERMSDSWTNPRYRDRYMPLIYRRESVQDIYAKMLEKGWL